LLRNIYLIAIDNKCQDKKQQLRS